jgi:hypothetical protein
MLPSQFDDHFKVFPYRSDFAGGRTNNGGIDLTREPHRISEISEATDFPELFRFISEMNTQESPFITLGCEAGEGDGAFAGYIEFSFKDERIANDIDFISSLDGKFYEWCSRQSPEMAQAIRAALAWEYSTFLYHGTAERKKIGFFFRATHQKAAGQLIDYIRHYLLNVCSCPL